MDQDRRLIAGRNLRTLAIALFWLVISGCLPQNSSPPTLEEEEGISAEQRLPEERRLEEDLISLLGYQDAETAILANTALQRTRTLAKKYGIVGFSLFHNFLVNLGLKDRGLCCHWTKDLLETLRELKLEKFRVSWTVSSYGSFREHSSVAVVPVGKDFKQGLVLDPWRHAGRLYWSKIDQDSYKWRPHPDDNGRQGGIDCEAGLKKQP